MERVNVRGRTKLTLYQKPFNSNTDYIEKDENGIITGLWANYFGGTAPTDPDTKPTPSPVTNILATITSSASTIKVGGSYKNLTVNLFNDSNEDITNEYADLPPENFQWTCSIDNEDWTDKVTWRAGTEYNQKKVKFSNDASVIGKILIIQCVIFDEHQGYINGEKFQFEITE